jgi:hypothetical protein
MVLFYENEIRPDKQFFFRPGIRVSFYQHNDFKYTSWQPRLYAVYKLDKHNQLDFSYNHMTQYLHMVTNPYMGINSDAWVPSTGELNPEESDMINLGYSYRDNKKLNIYADVYYKQLKRVTNYAEGKNLFLNTTDWGQNVQLGNGWCYGLETKAERVTDKWYLHLSYTLSWNWRKFAGLNNGDKFPFKYDRRHDLSVVGTYQLNKKWKLSGVFVYGSGNAVSLPERFYVIGGVLTQEYSKINQYRLAPYHRMDLSATLTPRTRPNQRWQQSWVFSIYNVYSRLNPYFVYFSQNGSPYDGSLTIEAQQVSLFPIIPAITWNFKF